MSMWTIVITGTVLLMNTNNMDFGYDIPEEGPDDEDNFNFD